MVQINCTFTWKALGLHVRGGHDGGIGIGNGRSQWMSVSVTLMLDIAEWLDLFAAAAGTKTAAD